MKQIHSYATFVMDNKVIIIIGETYVGLPLICYAPDVLIVPKGIYKKYEKDSFLFLNKEHNCKVVKI